jgi:class 3 adenylate cyclase
MEPQIQYVRTSDGVSIAYWAMNIAARISGEAAPGEVLVSQTVRDLARTSAGVPFEDRGEQEVKGVGEPVRVWAVRGA